MRGRPAISHTAYFLDLLATLDKAINVNYVYHSTINSIPPIPDQPLQTAITVKQANQGNGKATGKANSGG